MLQLHVHVCSVVSSVVYKGVVGCRPPGCSVCGVSQARVPECFVFPKSRTRLKQLSTAHTAPVLSAGAIVELDKEVTSYCGQELAQKMSTIILITSKSGSSISVKILLSDMFYQYC